LKDDNICYLMVYDNRKINRVSKFKIRADEKPPFLERLWWVDRMHLRTQYKISKISRFL